MYHPQAGSFSRRRRRGADRSSLSTRPPYRSGTPTTSLRKQAHTPGTANRLLVICRLRHFRCTTLPSRTCSAHRRPPRYSLSRPIFAHEAGVYDPDNDVVWITSNLLDDEPQGTEFQAKRVEISTVSLSTGQVTKVDAPSIRLGNGGCPWGSVLLMCDQGHGYERPSQLVVVPPSDPSSAYVLLNNFHGRPFNSINDVVVLPPHSSMLSQGQTSGNIPIGALKASTIPRGYTIWFTDPPYSHEQGFKPAPALPPNVYCLDPATGDIRVVADGFDHPNGIAFSPDGGTCYLTDSSHIHGTGRRFPHRQATM